MNRQDWNEYKSYLRSLIKPLKGVTSKEPASLTQGEFVTWVNNGNLKRELSRIR